MHRFVQFVIRLFKFATLLTRLFVIRHACFFGNLSSRHATPYIVVSELRRL
jgi:hypothetical protein